VVQPLESREQIQVLKQGISMPVKQHEKIAPEYIVESPVEKVVEKPVDRYDCPFAFCFFSSAIFAPMLN
jgi:hypothetical protein